MVIKILKDWLSAVYGLPVVDDFSDLSTKVERSISYDLTGEAINIRHGQGKVKFEFGFDIVYRVPAGFDAIGFLSIGLIDNSKYPTGFTLDSRESTEIIRYQTITEMIISKNVRAFIELEYNQVREQIKAINFEV